MRGKVVNISIGLLNILLGIVIAVFTFIVPQDITLITVQENQVRTYILIAIYAVMGVLVLFNLIETLLKSTVESDFVSFVAALTISAITTDNKRTPIKAETYLCSFIKFNILILVIINQSLILVLVATFMIKYLHFIVYILI